MNKVTSVIYRIFVPKYFRQKILEKKLPVSILKYYDKLPEAPSPEIKEMLDYLRTHPITVFPYSFQDQYIADDIEVFNDTERGLPYVLLDNKRLYFKRRWGKRKIRKLFNLLSKEQDLRSPHRYLSEQFTFENGEVLIDVGVAEGNFALSVAEKASRLILFEANKDWIEPLKATFEPWKDKVLIVNKFVGNINSSKSITLDNFITAGNDPVFLKIDVEGAESKVLAGAKRILSEQKPLKVAICTYHKQNDEKDFREMLIQNGFNISYSDGYMLFFYDKKMKPPYFRRGLIRAWK